MNISVLGTGVVGQTIAEKLLELGHVIMIGTRSVTEVLAKQGSDSSGRPAFREWYEGHKQMKLGTFAETAAFGDIIINATNGAGTLQALEGCNKADLANKVLLDISNPLDFSQGMPPTLFVSNTDSLGEQIQRAYPETKVVKSLNTMTAQLMVNPAILQDDHHVFVSGDDADAKTTVISLLKAFGWKERNIVDMGGISSARATEQILPIWIRLMGVLGSPVFNFKIVGR